MIVKFRFKSYLTKYKLLFIVLAFLCVLLLTQTTLEVVYATLCPSTEQIDVVYTWVNGSDPKFLKQLQHYSKNSYRETDFSEQRFSDKYELKFSLRSLERYAPWIGHVYIVTNGQIPYWLDLDYEKVTIVSHETIFLDSYDLPTFSSPAIEAHLHRIPGLSQRFIYLNDDIFLGAPIFREDFNTEGKGFVVYMAWPLPMCATDCPWLYVSDGECDMSCYNTECQMDGGDCDKDTTYISKNPITSDSGEIIETDYEEQQKNFLRHFNSATDTTKRNLTDLVSEHNKKVMLFDKWSRKKHARKTNSTLIEKIKKASFDAYGASLQHTNRVFNKKYGFTARYVPAHAPILIDRNIMAELQMTFRKEFEVTSRNRFRHNDDMQFSFSYYYYLIHEERNLDVSAIFDRFDTDESGTWSDREIRTLLAKLYELPLTYQMVEQFEFLLTNCSQREYYAQVPTPEFERYIDSRLPTITKQIVTHCPILVAFLRERFGKTAKYKHHVIKNSENHYVTFKMLSSNISDVVSHLDEIRQHTKKFVCLNDNMDGARTTENELVKAVLYDFYLSLFPKPSKFELRSDMRNRFLYMDELDAWKERHFKIKLCIYFFVIVLCYLTFFNVCKARYVCRLMNKFIKT